MKPNNKDIERIVKKAMIASKAEEPAFDFTDNVMSKIIALETQKNNSSPIISKKVWIIVAGFILALITYLYFSEADNQVSYFENYISSLNIDFNFLPYMSSFDISNVFMYAIIFFGIMFGIQIPIIKHYYFKRNEILNN